MSHPLDNAAGSSATELPSEGAGVSGKWVIFWMGVVSVVLAGLIIWLVLTTQQTPQ